MKVALCALAVLQLAHLAMAEEEEQGVNNENPCDESKCLSPDFYGGTDCWAIGPDTPKPNTCADGYEAHDLSSVASTFEILWYYACCPPGYTGPLPQEDCTDQVCTSPDGEGGHDCWADSVAEPMTCGGDVYRFPRHTTFRFRSYSRWFHYYVCCKTDDGTPPLQRQLVVAEGVRLALGSVALCCALALILGILLSRKARHKAFDLYLVVLTIPDAAANVCAIVVGSKAISGVHASTLEMSFVSAFSAAANIWLNAIIAHQLFSLLRDSHNARHTEPPSIKRVWMQTGIVYFFACGVGTWAVLLTNGNFGRHTVAFHGLMWAVIAVVPFTYMVYICICIWMEDLLSLSSRTRVVALYFFRLIIVYFVFWVPAIILISVEAKNVDWDGLPLHYIYWYLISMQTVTSVAMALTKPDLRSAVKNFLLLRWELCARNETTHPRFGLVRFVRGSSSSTASSSLVIGFWTRQSLRESELESKAGSQESAIETSRRDLHIESVNGQEANVSSQKGAANEESVLSNDDEATEP